MKNVTVSASTKYSIFIGEGILNSLSLYLSPFIKGKKVALISDRNVDRILGDKVISLLKDGGYEVYKKVVKGGEGSKSGKTYLSVLSYLAKNRFTRADTLIALGGGVIGDITGFIASSYLRGVSFIQIPTTLLAMVDSSVGGKTAINLPEGKNLVGAFYQPKVVVADTSLLLTLPKKEFACGMAEVIKYALAFDKELVDLLLKGDIDLVEIVARCVDLKKKVVEQDEFDKGDRQLLNFGHTLGHSIEKITNFKVSHGQAVAIGMQLITSKTVEKNLCNKEVFKVLCGLLRKYHLDYEKAFDIKKLVEISLVDKKRKDENITVVIPKEIGKCCLQEMTIEEWKEFIL